MSGSTESVSEGAALAWMESIGYAVLHAPDIATGISGAPPAEAYYCGLNPCASVYSSVRGV